jgi:rfaE bifunctional protein nucleotidyltransferase chain/domain
MKHMDILNSKILSGIQVSRMLAIAKLKEKKIVFTNGCFDILHGGHIDYLTKASDLGDILIIGLNSDASVKRIKGSDRPIQDQESRAKALASLFYVTYVVIFEEDTPLNLIAEVKPDVLVKGGDYKIENIVGHDIVKKNGGKTLTIPFLEGFSTTAIINKLKS